LAINDSKRKYWKFIDEYALPEKCASSGIILHYKLKSKYFYNSQLDSYGNFYQLIYEPIK